MGNSTSVGVRYCSQDLLGKDLSGKVIVITGGNSGIGWVAAKQFASQNAKVVLACRRPAAGTAMIEEDLRGGGDDASVKSADNIDVMQLDLASLASVRSFASEFMTKYDRLDVLINNAGVMACPLSKTEDGFEMQIGTNHLGHHLLTSLLLDTLKKSAPSRVLCVSGSYHDDAQGRKGHIDFDDLHFEKRPYDEWTSYAQSKLANVLHARELNRQLEGTGVAAVSLHPGFVDTNLVRHMDLPFFMGPVFRMMGQLTPWEGTQTTLHCALADGLKSGEYYAQTGPGTLPGGWPAATSEEGADLDVARRFYEVSDKLVGIEG